MRVFTQILLPVLFVLFSFSSGAQNWIQENSLSGLQALPNASFHNPTLKTNFNVTACGGTTRSLDATVTPDGPAPQASSGSMNNDVWIGFNALSTRVKVRVCDPTFDATVEVYRVSDGSFITSFNIAGNGGREYGMVNGLEIDDNYAVRVGRYSGSGMGTFTFNVEYFSISLSASYSPGPPGNSCYTKANYVQRTAPSTTPSNNINMSRWKFVPDDLLESDVTCTTNLGNMGLDGCFNFCAGTSFTAFCEARANDAECGNVWWGYTIGRPIEICYPICPGISTPANNASLTSIRNTSFTTSNAGSNAMMQWRFVTDNGATEFCSPWLPHGPYIPGSNCLEYNKFYEVYVRMRYCDDEPETDWCTPITIFSKPMPRLKFASENCCVWRNKIGTVSFNYDGFLMNQYRYRFTPVATTANPCPSQNLAPIGPALVTSWVSSQVIATPSSVQEGVIYNVQVQGRFNAANCSSCSGSQYSVPTRYVDWGPPCLTGIRKSNSPPPGTALSCGCNIGMLLSEDWDEEAYSALIAEYGIIEETVEEIGVNNLMPFLEEVQQLGVYQIEPGVMQMNLNSAGLEGEVNIKVYDLSGRMVSSEVVGTTENSDILIYTDSNLPSGIYVVTATGRNAVITEKIFIQQK